MPVRAVAASSVDLIVQLNVPATAGAGSAFEATITITNRGAETATDVGLSLVMDAGTASIAATAGTATGGASPAEQLTVSGTSVTGTIPSLPPLGTVTVVVTGRYPVTSSAAFEAAATVGPADTEIDPSTNTVTQNTALDRSASVSVSKTQDLSTVASGQTRTYTVTYTNTGTTDITGLTVRDQYNLGTNATRIESSVSCAPSSTAPCPTWANGTTQSNTNTTFIYPFNNPVNLPAGTSLVLTVPGVLGVFRTVCFGVSGRLSAA
ncbi:conserved repeat domain [Actinomyces howellii]|uniref:Conserved repeat domain n=1 Tax=Actinomyces howellii TaxID=52771 RepID=A0A448HG21_9ACTO|nr:conserved repeat domain [Actinomyces howellii]